MADYDLYSRVKPVYGTAGDVVMDGTTFTAEIDTKDFKSLTFLAALDAAAEYGNLAWSLTHSDSAGSGHAAVDADDLIFWTPTDTSETTQATHVGYRGKKRYVKAALDVDGVTTGAIDYDDLADVTPTSITSASTTVTVNKTAHGLVLGQYVTIAGAVQTDYNGTFRIASVPNGNSFTYTALSAPAASPATGTLTYAPRVYWVNDEGADIPSSITIGADALNGEYTITVDAITSGSTAYELAKDPTATGDGTITIGTITRAGANAIFEETLRLVCTAAAVDAGTFTVYRANGTSLGTITVGGGATTIQVGGTNAVAITIADGAADWAADDLFTLRITDLGKNRYVLTDPTGAVVGYPMGGTAFSSDHLSFTIPDSTVAVSDATAELTVTVADGLAKGQIMALLGHPLSGPIHQSALET